MPNYVRMAVRAEKCRKILIHTYFLDRKKTTPLIFGDEFRDVEMRSDVKPGIFKILYSSGFRIGALLPCMLCSLTVASKNVNLVHMKNLQKT